MIRGIISLHGDAFQRAGARAKTSVVYLTKRTEGDEVQPAAFVYESRYIGLDDVVPRTRASVAETARTKALQEMEDIAKAFAQYQEGKRGPWLVAGERLAGRLDAKALQPWSVSQLETGWSNAGVAADVLENILDVVSDRVTLTPDKEYQFLRISYEGRAERGEKALGKEISYGWVGQGQVGDIVVSNINAVFKAICVIPRGFEDLLISNEYTVMRLKVGVDADPQYIWAVLRSSAVIAEWLSEASGVGRTRVDWSILQKQRVPLLPSKKQREVGELYRSAEEYERQIARAKDDAQSKLANLELEGETAKDRLARAKPPK